MSWDPEHSKWYDLSTENNGFYGNEARVAKATETALSASVSGANITASLLSVSAGGLSLKLGIAGEESIGGKAVGVGTLAKAGVTRTKLNATSLTISGVEEALEALGQKLNNAASNMGVAVSQVHAMEKD